MSTDPKSTYYDHGGVQVIDIIRAKLTSEQYQGYLLGNVIKYAARLEWKGARERDAEKLATYAAWLRDELQAPPDERQERVRERYDFTPDTVVFSPSVDDLRKPDPAGQLGDYGACGVDAERPPDRHSTAHCPDGGACKHKCGLDPCKEASE